jgi:predicted  nucleic acid-binding Zn-ribbon protein
MAEAQGYRTELDAVREELAQERNKNSTLATDKEKMEKDIRHLERKLKKERKLLRHTEYALDVSTAHCCTAVAIPLVVAMVCARMQALR